MNKTEQTIKEMEGVFELANSKFDEFYKEADKQESGYCSTSASSGDYSKSASSGYYSKSASSGHNSESASLGTNSKSASLGHYSTSASLGHYSESTSSGDYSKSASLGHYSTSASSGYYSVASAVGYRSAVMGDLGNLLMCAEYKEVEGEYIPVGGKADIIDGVKLKENCYYIVEGGEWVEVDFSDGIFSYVLSTKGNVKKVKLDNVNVMYVVTSEESGKTAHGKSIKEAMADLIFKELSENMDKDELVQKIKEAQVVTLNDYRLITGACKEGCMQFLRDNNYAEDVTELPLSEVLKETQGQYGSDQFRKLLEA